MKRILSGILSSLLVLAYLVTSTGFGVHFCESGNTNDLVLLIGDISCEKIHQHYHENNIPHHHHSQEGGCDCCSHSDEQSCSESGAYCSIKEKDCCNTVVYSLAEDQNISQDESKHISDYITLCVLVSEHFISDNFITGRSIRLPDTRDPMLLKERNYQSELAQWRL